MNQFVIIDTNVLVSALLSNKDDAATVQIVSKVILGDITPVINQDILNEYKDVLSRSKFGFSQDIVDYLLAAIEKYGVYHEPEPSGTVITDKDDLPFFDLASDLQEYDSFLITGNKKHFPEVSFVLSPREYINRLTGK